ncbi:RING-H2 finger protein ATL10 [Biomphalaria pfeifferi]|uniref:RING-H2 finger protein ATL10 n=1 Tax=Biomphalaria pfeifferi TaxID=112525 RepID=A0AAD8BFR2_BIOPF|nr:RING-H2 finger protein ATL10 [Biomphalaria pfeifferi]
MSGLREPVRVKLEDLFRPDLVESLRGLGPGGVARALFQAFGLQCNSGESAGRSKILIEVDSDPREGQEQEGALASPVLIYSMREVLQHVAPGTWAHENAGARAGDEQWVVRHPGNQGAAPGAEGPNPNVPNIPPDLARIYNQLSRHGMLHPLRSRVVNPERFPIVVHDSAPPSDKCSICLEEYVTGSEKRVLTCGHEFHKKCADTWFAVPDRTVCPNCRREYLI